MLFIYPSLYSFLCSKLLEYVVILVFLSRQASMLMDKNLFHASTPQNLAKVQEQPQVNIFLVWLQNRLISGGLELVLSHTEKSFIVACYIQFSTNIKILEPILFGCAFYILGLTKLVLIL